MRLYSPPPGYIDLPYSWVFDASSLTNGKNYSNLLVYMQGGYGDFLLRRVVGVNRIVPSPGTYQLQDRNLAGLSQIPINGGSADDLGFAPELFYPELSAVRFNLANVSLAAPTTAAQIAFQGVRRMKSSAPRNPRYKATPKTYTYMVSVPVNAPIGSMVRTWVPITDTDFELYQLIILKSTLGSLCTAAEDQTGILFSQVNPALPIHVIAAIVGGGAVTASLAGGTLNIGLTGNAAIDTCANVISAIQTIPGISAAVTVALCGTEPFNPTAQFVEQDFTLGSAGGITPLTSPISTVWLYDVNRTAVSNIPMLDIFMDGGPGGVYKNGAIVTPLWYPKDSSIQIDVFSQSADGGQGLLILLVGRKYFPCD